MALMVALRELENIAKVMGWRRCPLGTQKNGELKSAGTNWK